MGKPSRAMSQLQTSGWCPPGTHGLEPLSCTSYELKAGPKNLTRFRLDASTCLPRRSWAPEPAHPRVPACPVLGVQTQTSGSGRTGGGRACASRRRERSSSGVVNLLRSQRACRAQRQSDTKVPLSAHFFVFIFHSFPSLMNHLFVIKFN